MSLQFNTPVEREGFEDRVIQGLDKPLAAFNALLAHAHGLGVRLEVYAHTDQQGKQWVTVRRKEQ